MSIAYPQWLFDESTPAGVDYTDSALVAEYDKRHESFRNYAEEAAKIGSVLGLSEDSVVLDLGCGTGGLTLHLAPRCRHVYAVDASAAMIEILGRKASAEGVANVTPVQGGLLTYTHEGDAPDAVVLNAVLHHLPDFWKQIALCRLHDVLKPGGRLFLGDVVFDFEPRDYRSAIDGWLSGMREIAGPRMAEETVVHVRDEFSTWDWILRGMLERAGFQIDSETEIMPFVRAFVCSTAKGRPSV